MAQPTWGVGDGGVEAAEVDEGIGAEEEVGDDGGNGIELGCGQRRKRVSCQWWRLSHAAGGKLQEGTGTASTYR